MQTIEHKIREAFNLVADSLIMAGYPERVRCAYELVETNEAAIALEINREYWETLKPYVVRSSNINECQVVKL